MIDCGFLHDESDSSKIIADWTLSDEGTLYFSIFSNGKDKIPLTLDLSKFTESIKEEYKGAIRTIIVPNGIEKITDSKQLEQGKGVFEGCTNLEKFEIHNDSFKLDEYAFKNCFSLKEVENLEALTGTVGHETFMNCTSLQKVSLENVYSIDSNAFENCVNLEEVNFNSLEHIAINKEAFLNCGNLKSIDLSIVGMIGESAFKNCVSLESADLVCNYIDCCTFQNCFNLDNVTFEKDCSKIFESAFENCSNLLSVEFKEGTPPYVGDKAFSHCENLLDINIPSMEQIGEEAFQYCKKLKTALFKNGVEIGDDAFFGSGLKNVDIPETFYPGESLFMCCHDLKNVKMPEIWSEKSDKVITAGEFSNTAIEDIQIPENTEAIDVDAFCNTNLSRIFIPDKVQEVAYMAVDKCGRLMSMSVSKETKMPDIYGTDLSEEFHLEERNPSVLDKMSDLGKDIKNKDLHKYFDTSDKSEPEGR